jgi:D-beta-D-heptose 7-phosphate kinase/D-beta-D-heptose 1-phosphate adenosyltransferase
VNLNLAALVDRFAGLRVVVVGDAILDSYLEGSAERLCREAPVPVVGIRSRRDVPGGAANTAANLSALGATVVFLSAVGDDREAEVLRETLDANGVPAGHLLTEPARSTAAKHRVIADGQVLCRFDQGSSHPVGPDQERTLIGLLEAAFPTCQAAIIADYGCGVLTSGVIDALAALQARDPRVLVVDAKDPGRYRNLGATACKPNYDEATQLLGVAKLDISSARIQQIAQSEERLLDLTGARLCSVTLDAQGALFFERGHAPYRTYANPQPASRAAGAGDTFTSALAMALAAGADTPAAAEIAGAAAAIVTARGGTLTCSGKDLREALSGGSKYFADVDRLATRVGLYRQQGRRVVFTNGCFDLLHRGHITFLNQAKALGDILVVGVNSDDSVRRLKGPGRPVNSLEDRLQILAELSCIDHLAAFEDDTPELLIRGLCPDVLAKGGNYRRDDLPEAALVETLGGNVEILPYLENHSTTRVMERIRTGNGSRDPNRAGLEVLVA